MEVAMIQRRVIVTGLCAAFGLPRRHRTHMVFSCLLFVLSFLPSGQECLGAVALATVAGCILALHSPASSALTCVYIRACLYQETFRKLQTRLDRSGPLLKLRRVASPILTWSEAFVQMLGNHHQAVSTWRHGLPPMPDGVKHGFRYESAQDVD